MEGGVILSYLGSDLEIAFRMSGKQNALIKVLEQGTHLLCVKGCGSRQYSLPYQILLLGWLWETGTDSFVTVLFSLSHKALTEGLPEFRGFFFLFPTTLPIPGQSVMLNRSAASAAAQTRGYLQHRDERVVGIPGA